MTFAIVVVKRSVINDRGRASEAADSFRTIFGPVPIVLVAQDTRGTATYFGRDDIVRFLAKISMSRIPWKEYTYS
ncbi:hypothetical protein V3331_16370 [Gaopeijia maritima]|uniref:hypothetical protein n=1 Tax=Gaopeijia maritima TaxID=3119007 RepID=UPI003245A2D6